jgi:hypothetical protein
MTMAVRRITQDLIMGKGYALLVTMPQGKQLPGRGRDGTDRPKEGATGPAGRPRSWRLDYDSMPQADASSSE